ncbi:MAG: hypothetical protein U9R54_03880, partial [Bacteroidota bacterium]|nr:hypothetical protein [Bacteroidota bacterium]
IVISIFSFLDNKIIGLILFLLGVSIVFIHQGIMLDNDNKLIYRYIKLFVFEKKAAIDFSKVEYLSIVKVNFKQTMNVLTISNTQSKTMYKVNLIFVNNKYKELFKGELSDVIEKSKLIADTWNLRILNLSTGKKEWIEPN